MGFFWYTKKRTGVMHVGQEKFNVEQDVEQTGTYTQQQEDPSQQAKESWVYGTRGSSGCVLVVVVLRGDGSLLAFPSGRVWCRPRCPLAEPLRLSVFIRHLCVCRRRKFSS